MILTRLYTQTPIIGDHYFLLYMPDLPLMEPHHVDHIEELMALQMRVVRRAVEERFAARWPSGAERMICWPKEWMEAAVKAGLAVWTDSGTIAMCAKGGDALRDALQVFASEIAEWASEDTPAPEATPHEWRDPKDKPPNLPGEHHSQDVLLKMNPRRMLGDDDHGIRIGHVSCGHWRPSGGNGNFDADVLGWMPLPSYPLPQPLPTISTKGETP